MSGFLKALLILGLAGQVNSDLVSVTGVDPAVAEAARVAVIKVVNERTAARSPARPLPVPIDQYHFRIFPRPDHPADRVRIAGLVQVFGLCRVHSERWRSETDLMVADGGDCYFDAIYNPASKRVVAFDFNGRA